MSLAAKRTLLSVEEYLAMELGATVKSEYVGGVVYAMSGARNAHNQIATNTLVALGGRLRGTQCRPFNSDTKIRLRLPSHVRFYYPDASVICHSNPPSDSFQDAPSAIVEVLSRSTRRIDEGEKREAYLTIPSLSVFLLIEQDGPTVIAYRRTEHGFVQEVHHGLDAAVPLPELHTELPLADIYDGIAFVPELEAD